MFAGLGLSTLRTGTSHSIFSLRTFVFLYPLSVAADSERQQEDQCLRRAGPRFRLLLRHALDRRIHRPRRMPAAGATCPASGWNPLPAGERANVAPGRTLPSLRMLTSMVI